MQPKTDPRIAWHYLTMIVALSFANGLLVRERGGSWKIILCSALLAWACNSAHGFFTKDDAEAVKR